VRTKSCNTRFCERIQDKCMKMWNKAMSKLILNILTLISTRMTTWLQKGPFIEPTLYSILIAPTTPFFPFLYHMLHNIINYINECPKLLKILVLLTSQAFHLSLLITTIIVTDRDWELFWDVENNGLLLFLVDLFN